MCVRFRMVVLLWCSVMFLVTGAEGSGEVIVKGSQGQRRIFSAVGGDPGEKSKPGGPGGSSIAFLERYAATIRDAANGRDGESGVDKAASATATAYPSRDNATLSTVLTVIPLRGNPQTSAAENNVHTNLSSRKVADSPHVQGSGVTQYPLRHEDLYYSHSGKNEELGSYSDYPETLYDSPAYIFASQEGDESHNREVVHYPDMQDEDYSGPLYSTAEDDYSQATYPGYVRVYRPVPFTVISSNMDYRQYPRKKVLADYPGHYSIPAGAEDVRKEGDRQIAVVSQHKPSSVLPQPPLWEAKVKTNLKKSYRPVKHAVLPSQRRYRVPSHGSGHYQNYRPDQEPAFYVIAPTWNGENMKHSGFRRQPQTKDKTRLSGPLYRFQDSHSSDSAPRPIIFPHGHRRKTLIARPGYKQSPPRFLNPVPSSPLLAYTTDPYISKGEITEIMQYGNMELERLNNFRSHSLGKDPQVISTEQVFLAGFKQHQTTYMPPTNLEFPRATIKAKDKQPGGNAPTHIFYGKDESDYMQRNNQMLSRQDGPQTKGSAETMETNFIKNMTKPFNEYKAFVVTSTTPSTTTVVESYTVKSTEESVIATSEAPETVTLYSDSGSTNIVTYRPVLKNEETMSEGNASDIFPTNPPAPPLSRHKKWPALDDFYGYPLLNTLVREAATVKPDDSFVITTTNSPQITTKPTITTTTTESFLTAVPDMDVTSRTYTTKIQPRPTSTVRTTTRVMPTYSTDDSFLQDLLTEFWPFSTTSPGITTEEPLPELDTHLFSTSSHGASSGSFSVPSISSEVNLRSPIVVDDVNRIPTKGKGQYNFISTSPRPDGIAKSDVSKSEDKSAENMAYLVVGGCCVLSVIGLGVVIITLRLRGRSRLNRSIDAIADDPGNDSDDEGPSSGLPQRLLNLMNSKSQEASTHKLGSWFTGRHTTLNGKPRGNMAFPASNALGFASTAKTDHFLSGEVRTSLRDLLSLNSTRDNEEVATCDFDAEAEDSPDSLNPSGPTTEQPKDQVLDSQGKSSDYLGSADGIIFWTSNNERLV